MAAAHDILAAAAATTTTAAAAPPPAATAAAAAAADVAAPAQTAAALLTGTLGALSLSLSLCAQRKGRAICTLCLQNPGHSPCWHANNARAPYQTNEAPLEAGFIARATAAAAASGGSKWRRAHQTGSVPTSAADHLRPHRRSTCCRQWRELRGATVCIRRRARGSGAAPK